MQRRRQQEAALPHLPCLPHTSPTSLFAPSSLSIWSLSTISLLHSPYPTSSIHSPLFSDTQPPSPSLPVPHTLPDLPSRTIYTAVAIPPRHPMIHPPYRLPASPPLNAISFPYFPCHLLSLPLHLHFTSHLTIPSPYPLSLIPSPSPLH